MMRTAKQPLRASAPTQSVRRPPPAPVARSNATASVLRLQRWYGNRAVGSLIGPTGVQRDVGWPEATGINKGKGTVPGSKMVRIPLAGLPKGNLEPAPNTAKTKELAGGPEGGRAIVWFHTNLKVDQPVQVVVHLHGLTSRGVDPFPGWRETHEDPKASEVEPARKAAEKAGQPFTNPLAGKVRDIERDRIVQQIEALNDPQVMAILPQGTGLGGTAAFGKDFNPDTLVSDVFKRLVAEKLISAAELPAYTIMLSAHSAGGAVVADVLNKKRTSRVGGLILFDALWGEPSKDDPKKTVSWQRDALLNWIEAGCKALAPTLKDLSKTADEKQQAINALPGVRGLWEGGYSNTYEDLQARINRIVRTWIPDAFVPAVSTKFLITKVGTSHDRIVGGTGGTGVEAGPLEHALKQRGTFVSRTVQRDTPGAKKVAKVKLTWDGELKNKTQLQPVLDKHPADLNADVTEGKKVVATADTTATFEVSPSPAKRTFTVVPKATKPDDYFLAKSTKVDVEADKTVEATVTLPYNRDNIRFTERTWEAEGIDVAKANNVTSATLFGKSVSGGLNKLTETKVKDANDWFDKNVTAAEKTAAQASILSIAGRVKRTQSRGTYSNHSTGVAVDINPSNESLQNWHVKKDDKHHAKAMKVFNTVVSQPSLLDQMVTAFARMVYPGAPDLSPFKGFDMWKERDRDRLLEASERFNAFFPQYLQRLAAEADPAQTPPPTVDSVMTLSTAQLEALAKKATAAKKADVATSLGEIAAVWFEVRAWVRGYVKGTRVRKKKTETVWMLRDAFEKEQKKDKTLKREGELVGMISLHPAIVKALTNSGWSWMVDYKHDDEKDFMHFEDRAAQKDLTK